MAVKEKQRVKISRADDRYTITVPAMRKGRTVLLTLCAVTLFFFLNMLPLVIPFEASRLGNMLILSARFALFGAVPFLSITVVFAACLAINIWAFFASEQVAVTLEQVCIAKTLFSIGHRTRLSLHDIIRVSYIPSTKSINPTKRNQTFTSRSFHEGKISIICSRHTYSFGRALEDFQAARIADELDRMIRRYRDDDATDASQTLQIPAH